MAGVEREWKLALSEEEASKIEDACGPPLAIVEQRNHYLDTADQALRARRFGLRLREETTVSTPHSATSVSSPNEAAAQQPATLPARHPGARARQFIISLKGPTDKSKGFWERSEQQFTIAEDIAREALRGSVTPRKMGLTLPAGLADLADAPLVQLGSMTNDRHVFHVRLEATGGDEAVFELDRTTYPDGAVEHELEVSWAAPDRPVEEDALRSALARIGVGWHPSKKGKFAKFLERSGLDKGA